jgi:uncharacterized iron-regulated membrane protein
MVTGSTRTLLRRLHLWLGLVFGLVMALSGLTGCLLVWIHEIDATLNPELFHVAAPPGVSAQPTPARLREIVDMLEARPGYGRPSQLGIPAGADESVVAWFRPARAEKPSALALEVSRQVMIDPHTLAILGEREWGRSGLSRAQFMPTLFHLHRYLLAGEAGKTVIGVTGLMLALLTLLGIALWWPKMTLASLRKSLTISFRGSWPRLNYSSHRTVGMAVAPVLLMLGISGLYFNLPAWVTPAVQVFSPVTKGDKVKNRAAGKGAPIGIDTALLAAQGRFPQGRLSRLTLPSSPATPYEVRLRQPGEVRQGDGNTRVSVDARSGGILRVRDPMRASGGDTFLNWLFPLHTGEAFGMAGKIVMSLTGLTPLLFLVTGVAVWLNRRRKPAAAARSPSPAAL